MPAVTGIWLAIVLVVSSLHTVTATLWPQTDWIFPTPPDNTSTLIVGKSYTIEWSDDMPNAYDYYVKTGSPTSAALYAVSSAGDTKQVSSGKLLFCSNSTWSAKL